MKTTAILFLAYLALCVQCSVPENKSTKKEISTQPIKVGVFDGHGGAQTCIWETVAAIRLDPEMEVCTITTADIANNVLDSIDAIIIPGGSGKSQYLNLGTLNQQRIKDFIAKGKGAVGICAGAYLFSNTPDYTCIQLNGQQAIDIEHDNRGHGLAKFTLCEEGKKIFPELADRDTSFVIYYEGPVFINNPADTIQSNTLAIIKRVTTTSVERITVVPDAGKQKYILCRFSPDRGLLPGNDLTGDVVLLQLDKESDGSFTLTPASPKAARTATYRVAADVVCTVYCGTEELTRATLPLFEFGRDVELALPSKK